MLCLSGFELYSRWVPLTSDGKKTGQDEGENSIVSIPATSYPGNHFG